MGLGNNVASGYLQFICLMLSTIGAPQDGFLTAALFGFKYRLVANLFGMHTVIKKAKTWEWSGVEWLPHKRSLSTYSTGKGADHPLWRHPSLYGHREIPLAGTARGYDFADQMRLADSALAGLLDIANQRSNTSARGDVALILIGLA